MKEEGWPLKGTHTHTRTLLGLTEGSVPAVTRDSLALNETKPRKDTTAGFMLGFKEQRRFPTPQPAGVLQHKSNVVCRWRGHNIPWCRQPAKEGSSTHNNPLLVVQPTMQQSQQGNKAWYKTKP
jgi:hypothetical protein